MDISPSKRFRKINDFTFRKIKDFRVRMIKAHFTFRKISGHFTFREINNFTLRKIDGHFTFEKISGHFYREMNLRCIICQWMERCLHMQWKERHFYDPWKYCKLFRTAITNSKRHFEFTIWFLYFNRHILCMRCLCSFIPQVVGNYSSPDIKGQQMLWGFFFWTEKKQNTNNVIMGKCVNEQKK